MKQSNRKIMSGPKLYIQQPHMKPPRIKMQEHYRGLDISRRIFDAGREVEKMDKMDLDHGIDTKEILDESGINRGIENRVSKMTELENFTEPIVVEKPETFNKDTVPVEIEINQEIEKGIPLEKKQLENSADHDQAFSLLPEQLEEINEQETKQKKATPFHLLNLEEKLSHLKRVPGSIAKIRYEFVTISRVYLGYFISMHDDSIIIKPHNNRNKIGIKKDKLVNIILKGL